MPLLFCVNVSDYFSIISLRNSGLIRARPRVLPDCGIVLFHSLFVAVVSAAPRRQNAESFYLSSAIPGEANKRISRAGEKLTNAVYFGSAAFVFWFLWCWVRHFTTIVGERGPWLVPTIFHHVCVLSVDKWSNLVCKKMLSMIVLLMVVVLPSANCRCTAASELLSVSASRGPVFRRHLLNEQIDQDKIWAQGVSACDLIFHNILLEPKIPNFSVLPLTPNVKNWDMAE